MSDMVLTDDYQEVSKAAMLASQYLADLHMALGQPATPLSDTGEKIVNVIFAIWQELYPLDAKTWSNDMREYKNAEMSTREQVAQKTGRSLASVPRPIYEMMMKVFPDYKLDTRDDWLKFLKRYPIFRAANKL